MKTYRRQNPVSCQLCRSKKLKCDRQQPCSNCSARGVTCNFQQSLVRQTQSEKEEGLVSEIPAILARLRRLEAAVASGRGEPLPPLTPCGRQPSSDTASRPLSLHDEYGQQPSTSFAPQKSNLSDDEAHWKEYQSFERTGMRDRSLVFRKCSGLKVQAAEHTGTGPSVASFDHVSASILLPSQIDAVVLMQRYFEHVDYHHHILYSPTVRALVSRVYASLPSEQYPSPGRIALLLTIFASTAYFWRLTPIARHLFRSPQDALEAGRVWAIAALDILELSRRVATSSLEDVQATIIASSLFYHAEGYSSRTRATQNMALTMARDLGLHRVNYPRRPNCGSAGAAIENEMKRRVWWHLAAKDWLLAFTGGQQEGTYFVQPRHMCVDLPQNVDDKDIPVDGRIETTDLSKATGMSFFLQQIRLAELCRAITDQLPPFLVPSHNLEYDSVLAIDAKFQSFLDDLPVYFRLDPASRSSSLQIVANSPHMVCQRNLIHIELHIRRSKLHQPLLFKGLSDSRYARSRELCLVSACTVLEVSHRGESEDGASEFFPTRLAAIIHHIFMAAMILVLELSYNKQAYRRDREVGAVPQQAARYRAAIMEACTMLERAAKNSRMASNLLQTFTQILCNHSITVSTDGRGTTASGNSTGGAFEVSPDPWLAQSNAVPPVALEHASGDGISGLDALLQGYIDLGSNFEVPMWQGLFADLESWGHVNP